MGAVIGTGSGGTMAVPLRPQWLRSLLPVGRAGVYVLLVRDVPRYVGRSDACLLARLCGHELRPEVSHVVWSLCAGRLQAYRAECFWFHALAGRPLLNRAHPASPPGLPSDCPFCGPGMDRAVEAVAKLSRPLPSAALAASETLLGVGEDA